MKNKSVKTITKLPNLEGILFITKFIVYLN